MQRQRAKNGQFLPGNRIAKQGWLGLVQKRFQGDIGAAREWVGAIGAWAYDAPYRAKGWGAFPYPGNPEEFKQRRDQAIDSISMGNIQELQF
jgi:hypothetical protein